MWCCRRLTENFLNQTQTRKLKVVKHQVAKNDILWPYDENTWQPRKTSGWRMHSRWRSHAWKHTCWIADISEWMGLKVNNAAGVAKDREQWERFYLPPTLLMEDSASARQWQCSAGLRLEYGVPLHIHTHTHSVLTAIFQINLCWPVMPYLEYQHNWLCICRCLFGLCCLWVEVNTAWQCCSDWPRRSCWPAGISRSFLLALSVATIALLLTLRRHYEDYLKFVFHSLCRYLSVNILKYAMV